ncbi:putative pregnancy-specific beta-1-glycoprotein 7, partial [Sapajus apella]|uniref:Pregnancy-specific beta-1-glycoprotein 7 n=1 Tax=Sapajus apella TaxID=9515 RepID=A0A6J3GMU4_SAPAP
MGGADGPDTPTISPSDSYCHPGTNLSLSCHTTSNPPAQYFWTIYGRNKATGFADCCLAHLGVLTWNGQLLDPFQLQSYFAPLGFLLCRPLVDREGSLHTTSNPPAQYFWTIYGRIYRQTQEICIPQITAKDNGLYGCFAQNLATCKRSSIFKTITVP